MATKTLVAMTFGERLKKLRKGKRLTQEQLAREADITLSAVRNLEQTDAEPTWETAQKLARALGITLDALAGGK